MTMDIQKLK